MIKILDGHKLSQKLTPVLADKIKKLVAEKKIRPKLVIIQIGNLEESNVYIRKKCQFGEHVGAIVEHKKYPVEISEQKIISEIEKLNKNNSVHGIMIQLPIPKTSYAKSSIKNTNKILNTNKIIETIDQKKDVDGLTAKNTKLLFDNIEANVNEAFIPATTQGILTLLDHYKINCTGKKIVMVGDSALVGRPTAIAFLNRRATLTICHNETKNLKGVVRDADIVITAIGRHHFFNTSYFSKNQVLIDVGFSVVHDGRNGIRRVLGDIDFDKVVASQIAIRAITPVPGGVGPMTVYSLFDNLVKGALEDKSV